MKSVILIAVLFALCVPRICSSEAVWIDLPSDRMAMDDSQCTNYTTRPKSGCSDTGKGQYRDAVIDGSRVTAIFTRPNTFQRVKLRTERSDFSYGEYAWRVYVPAVPERDAISIGVFLYQDDAHELDFECGYGKEADREAVGADQSDEIVCFMTAHRGPVLGKRYHRTKIVTDRWHVFRMEIARIPGSDFVVSWYIDDQLVYSVDPGFDPATRFCSMISVEHLEWIGDGYPPKQGLTAYFDWFRYTPERMTP